MQFGKQSITKIKYNLNQLIQTGAISFGVYVLLDYLAQQIKITNILINVPNIGYINLIPNIIASLIFIAIITYHVKEPEFKYPNITTKEDFDNYTNYEKNVYLLLLFKRNGLHIIKNMKKLAHIKPNTFLRFKLNDLYLANKTNFEDSEALKNCFLLFLLKDYNLYTILHHHKNNNTISKEKIAKQSICSNILKIIFLPIHIVKTLIIEMFIFINSCINSPIDIISHTVYTILNIIINILSPLVMLISDLNNLNMINNNKEINELSDPLLSIKSKIVAVYTSYLNKEETINNKIICKVNIQLPKEQSEKFKKNNHKNSKRTIRKIPRPTKSQVLSLS